MGRGVKKEGKNSQGNAPMESVALAHTLKVGHLENIKVFAFPIFLSLAENLRNNP